MHPRLLLRVEGLAVFVAATLAYVALDGPLWLYLVLALAPDVGMAGYLAGPRVGSLTYNTLHTYPVSLAFLGVGLWQGLTTLSLVALVWTAHIGMDRFVGYGLKYPTTFDDSHLGRLDEAHGSDPTVRDAERAD